MEIILSRIQLLPVIVVAALSFGLGALWHSKKMFGPAWTAENAHNHRKKMNIPLVFIGTALAHLAAICALDVVVSARGAMLGFLTGFAISIVWILPAMAETYLFANRSMKLLAIDAGMYVVLFSLAGLILGTW